MWKMNHPTEDCEAFILVEMLEDADGFRKGDILMSTDWYNAEEDTWLGVKDYHKVLKWQQITFPPVPKEYEGRVQTVIHTFSSHSIEYPQRNEDHLLRDKDCQQRENDHPTGGIMYREQSWN